VHFGRLRDSVACSAPIGRYAVLFHGLRAVRGERGKEGKGLDKRTSKRRTGNGSDPKEPCGAIVVAVGAFPFVLPYGPVLPWLSLTFATSHLTFLFSPCSSSSIPEQRLQPFHSTTLHTPTLTCWCPQPTRTMARSILTWARAAAIAALAQQVVSQTCCKPRSTIY
jgi:hypothetical protein